MTSVQMQLSEIVIFWCFQNNRASLVPADKGLNAGRLDWAVLLDEVVMELILGNDKARSALERSSNLTIWGYETDTRTSQ